MNQKIDKKSVPTYFYVPFSVFKYRLESSIEGLHSIEHMLNTNEHLHLIHELAISINDICFLKRKQDF